MSINILENTIYFLALINPFSKILLLSTKRPAFSKREIFSVSLRSTLTALLILLVLIFAGNFFLVNVFHVEIYSLSVAGGIIIFLVGLSAVREGRFFYEDPDAASKADIAIVPLATPFIAGPGVITAAISAASLYGVVPTIFCLLIAIAINFILMIMSLEIGKVMEKVHATGPVVRITGLVITAVAAQMILSGCGEWLKTVMK